MAASPENVGDVLRVLGLSKSYGDVPVLEKVNLSLRKNELAILSGENGAGKSTLLECIAGAQPMDEGHLTLDGRSTSPQHRSHWQAVYSILDDFAWFPDLTIFDHYRLLDPGLRRADALAHLATLRAETYIDRKAVTLSSGQRQRCALVSAVVRSWSVLLIDEPERHLDRDVIPLLAALLLRLSNRGAVLVASHEDLLTGLAGTRRLSLEGANLVGPP